MHTHVAIPKDIEIPKNSLWHRMPIVGFLLGVSCLVYWFLQYKHHPQQAAYSYLFAYCVALSLVLGSMGFVLIQHITRAGWSVVVRRVPETAMASIPVLVILFIPIYMMLHDIYPWTHAGHLDAILKEKAPYLNVSFFVYRCIGYFAVWLVIGLWFYRQSYAMDGNSHYEKIRAMWSKSAPAVIVFALTLTFASFDWLMSLQPHWYSTIFGVYFFAGAMLAALSFMILVFMSLQKSGLIKHAVTKEHYQDLGKLMFGFTVFWAYVAFSQFMLIWYANIPEEVEFYLHRLHHGWSFLTWSLPVMNFFVPFFFMMSRHVKRNRLGLAFACIYTFVVHAIDIYWLVMPNAGHMHVSLIDVASFVGIFSLVFSYFTFLLTKRHVIPSGDPRLSESLAFENF